MKIKLPKFQTKSELFSYLTKNKEELIDLKKSAFKTTDNFGSTEFELAVCKEVNVNLSADTNDVINRTVIGNTYYWLDSHGDVHLKGLFSKSISERKNRIWHLHDHEYAITAKVGVPKRIYEKSIEWSKLNVNKEGETEALFMDTSIKKDLNASIFDGYRTGEINQHSVSMQYVKMDLCINDEEYKDEFANWNKYIDLLGNKSKAEERGFFWAIKEAKLTEISCVLEGSNELTPTLEVSAKADTTEEPDLSTQKKPSEKPEALDIDQLFKNLKFN